MLVKYKNPNVEVYARDLLGCKVGDKVVTSHEPQQVGEVTGVFEKTSEPSTVIVYSKCESTVTKKLEEYYKLVDKTTELLSRYGMLVNKFDRLEILHAVVAHYISDPRVPAGAYGDMQVLEDTRNKTRKLAEELGL